MEPNFSVQFLKLAPIFDDYSTRLVSSNVARGADIVIGHIYINEENVVDGLFESFIE